MWFSRRFRQPSRASRPTERVQSVACTNEGAPTWREIERRLEDCPVPDAGLVDALKRATAVEPSPPPLHLIRLIAKHLEQAEAVAALDPNA